MIALPPISRFQGGHTSRHLAATALLAFVAAFSGGCGNFASRGMNHDGVVLLEQGQYSAAVQEFQDAMYADPSNADSYFNLAETYHRIGKQTNNRSELDQAETLYNQCLDRDPEHSKCYRSLAVLLVEEGRSTEAFRLLEGWVTRDPTSAEARMRLAQLQREFGDVQGAQTQLAEAVQLDPQNAAAYVALGQIWEQLGSPAQALVNYQRALAIDQSQSDVAARVTVLQAATGMAPQPLMAEQPPERFVTRNADLRR